MSNPTTRHLRRDHFRLSGHLVFLSLIVFFLTPRLAFAGERKVLVARPHLAAGVTSDHDSAIMKGIYRGLTAAKAYSVGEGDIGDDLKAAGVTSLDTKAASMKVAKAIGAYAVLRYEAKLVDDKIKVRVALFTTQTESLAFLDRLVAVDAVGDAVASMTRALMGVTVAASDARSVGRGEGASSSSTASSPEGSPEAATSPLARRLFHQPNPYAAGGFVIEAQVGLAAPVGDDADVMTVGLRAGATFGWQFGIGNFQSIMAGARVVLARTGYDDAALMQINATDGSFLNIGILAGARYSLYLASFSLWSGFYLGVDVAREGFSNALTSDSDSGVGFGLAWEFGAHYMIVPRFGVGFFMDVVGAFIGALDVAHYEYSATTFGFGLSLRTVL